MKGVPSSPDGWEREYFTKRKVVILAGPNDASDTGFRPKDAQPSFQDNVVCQAEDTFSDFHESDCDPVSAIEWGFPVDSFASERAPSSRESADDIDLCRKFRIAVGDRGGIRAMVSREIDTTNYYVCSSDTDNHIHSLWKKR